MVQAPVEGAVTGLLDTCEVLSLFQIQIMGLSWRGGEVQEAEGSDKSIGSGARRHWRARCLEGRSKDGRGR